MYRNVTFQKEIIKFHICCFLCWFKLRPGLLFLLVSCQDLMLIPILSFKRKSCILLARYNAWSSALFDYQYILSILSVYPKDRQSSSQPNHEKLQKNSSSKQDYRWKHWCQYLELLAVSKIYSSLSEICLHSTESLLIAFDLPLANEIDFFPVSITLTSDLLSSTSGQRFSYFWSI